MKIHLCLLLLAAGISAAPQTSSMAELLTLLQQMSEATTKDMQNLRIETPDNIDTALASGAESISRPNRRRKPAVTNRFKKSNRSSDGCRRDRAKSLDNYMGHLDITKHTLPETIIYQDSACRDVNCVSTIFEGTEQLKTSPAMKKFSVFFQKFERLKQSLTPSLAKEGQCDTERKNAAIFLEKLMTFIRKASKNARA